MTLYADLCYNRPKFTFEEHIGALKKWLYNRFNFINGDFITGFYCISSLKVKVADVFPQAWLGGSAWRVRTRWRRTSSPSSKTSRTRGRGGTTTGPNRSDCHGWYSMIWGHCLSEKKIFQIFNALWISIHPVGSPLSCDILWSIFNMFQQPLGWWWSYINYRILWVPQDTAKK